MSDKKIIASDYKREKRCVRCNTKITKDTGVVRRLCSPCDLELQTMHWSIEHKLFDRTTYMPETAAESTELSPSAEWFVNHNYVLKKPPLPRRRDFFRHKANEAMAL